MRSTGPAGSKAGARLSTGPQSLHYTPAFYSVRHEESVRGAEAVLALVRQVLPPIKSAVDVGCGVGTWLSVLSETGVDSVHGFDGSWVPCDELVIPRESFTTIDLETEALPRDERYDLAICLELAEHLPASAAADLVGALTRLSDFVLFSAAIPMQGGRRHINEQWPDYWAKLFADLGHVTFDTLRPQIWQDRSIPFWYRQNLLLFIRRERVKDTGLPPFEPSRATVPMSMVHPDLYLSRDPSTATVRQSWRLLVRALKRGLEKRARRIFGWD
jgi:hypothetical protein